MFTRRSSILCAAVALLAHSALAQDTTLIRVDSPAAWGTVRLTPAITVGTLDGPPEYALGTIDHLVGATDGSFYTFDRKDTQIRHYDRTGRFVGKVGRKGSGPGEYQQILGMALLGDTLLVTWDPSNLRVSYFGADGKFRRSFRPSIARALYGEGVFTVANSGVIVFRGLKPAFEEVPRYEFIRFRPDGTLIDTFAGPPSDGRGFRRWTVEGSKPSFMSDITLQPDLSGGMIGASTTRLGFTRRVDGEVSRVERRYQPVGLHPEERAQWNAIAAAVNKRQQCAGAPCVTIPKMKPAHHGVTADRDGRIWLEMYGVAEKREIVPSSEAEKRVPLTWLEPTSFEVFSSSGSYLGRVGLPRGHQLMDVRGDLLWTLGKGPDDEERIVVLRMVREKR